MYTNLNSIHTHTNAYRKKQILYSFDHKKYCIMLTHLNIFSSLLTHRPAIKILLTYTRRQIPYIPTLTPFLFIHTQTHRRSKVYSPLTNGPLELYGYNGWEVSWCVHIGKIVSWEALPGVVGNGADVLLVSWILSLT